MKSAAVMKSGARQLAWAAFSLTIFLGIAQQQYGISAWFALNVLSLTTVSHVRRRAQRYDLNLMTDIGLSPTPPRDYPPEIRDLILSA
jgi:hypothetical protein